MSSFTVWRIPLFRGIFRGRASNIAVRSRCRPASTQSVQVPESCGRYVFPISAGLAPAGSQLVGYNERSALTRSPSGKPNINPKKHSTQKPDFHKIQPTHCRRTAQRGWLLKRHSVSVSLTKRRCNQAYEPCGVLALEKSSNNSRPEAFAPFLKRVVSPRF